MNKLTAKKCRELVKQLRASRDVFGPLPEKEDYKLQALEIALPVLEQQERGHWIEWSGGNCPVPVNSRVDIKFRDGDIGLAKSAYWDWNHRGYRSDIIAYRIIPEQPTNQNGEQ